MEEETGSERQRKGGKGGRRERGEEGGREEGMLG